MRLLFITLLFLPIIASADFVLTEVMYDLPGGDENREWVEVLNSGENALSLSSCRFIDDKGQHKLVLVRGAEMVESGRFAIIAVSAEKFMSDYPLFDGILYDSGYFTLNNSGETLSLTCSSSTLSYKSSMGAKGTGDSIQLINDSLFSSTPTPGEANMLKKQQKTNEEIENKNYISNIETLNQVPSSSTKEISLEADDNKSGSLQDFGQNISLKDRYSEKYVWFSIMIASIFVTGFGIYSALKFVKKEDIEYKIIEEKE